MVVAILMVISINSFSQKRIFKDYDFNDGEYALYIMDNRYDSKWIRDSSGNLLVQHKTDNYMIDDLDVLINMRDNWIADPVYERYECGYDFVLYLTKDDVTILDMLINLECEELIIDSDAYNFSPILFERYRSQFTKLDKQMYFCDSIEEGREFWINTTMDSMYVKANEFKPPWVDFEGELTFTYISGEKKYYTEIEPIIVNKIRESYPSDSFKLDRVSWPNKMGDNEYQYTISIFCNESLKEKFKLYEIEKWDKFDSVSFTIYKKKKRD